MYAIFLSLHNIIRWVALILGLLAAIFAFIGWFGKREWSERYRKLGSFFTITMDIQILFGLLLYIAFSPITRLALSNFGSAIASKNLRFFSVEHGVYMLIALVFAHLGSILPRKISESSGKYKRAAIFFGLAVLLLLLGMPWGRPIFPGLG